MWRGRLGPFRGGRGRQAGQGILPSRGHSGACVLHDTNNSPPARMRVRLDLIFLESNTTFWWAMRWAKVSLDWDRSRKAATEPQ